ncbi:MAG TPA: hypothetical protein VK395_31570 [Gemmataceae bacterium]|nr:hypothetical protein [Gemmataceae bacterium]
MKKLLACALICGLAGLGCTPASTSSKGTGSGPGKVVPKPADSGKPETPSNGKTAPKVETPPTETKVPSKAADKEKSADKDKSKGKDKDGK